MIPQMMATAPKDRPILIWAQWDWDGMYLHKTDEPFAWRVAEWREEYLGDDRIGFWSVSSNPYSDLAIRPMAWVELPEPLK